MCMGFYIVCHGSEDKFWIKDSSVLYGPDKGWREVSANSIYNCAKAAGYKDGSPVRLISCLTGSTEDGAAQNLANQFNARILAPTNKVWIQPNGTLTLGPEADVYEGEWVNFYPESINP